MSNGLLAASYGQSRTYKALVLASGRILASIAGLIIMAVLSRVFSKHEYGTYKQVLLCFAIVIPFLKLGIPTALYYYLPTETKRPRGIITDNFTLLAFLGLIYLVFVFLGGARFLAVRMNNPDIEGLLYLIAPYGIIQLLRASLPACFMSANRAKLLAIFNGASRSCECIFIIITIFIFRSLTLALAATMIGAGIVLFLGIIAVFCVYHSGPFLPSLEGMKRQLRYGAPLAIAAIFASIMGYLDQLIVSLKCSTDSYAVYVNGSIKLPLLSVIVASVTAVLLPELTVLSKNGDKPEMLRIWQNAMVKSSYVFLPVAVFMMFLANDAILLLFTEKYAASTPVFRIFLLMLPFQMIAYGPIFHASNKNKYIIVINIVTLAVHIPLLFFSITYFGILGAAIATAFSQVCVRIFLHIVFIGRIVECPVSGVFPTVRIWRILAPLILLALPITLRYTLKIPPFTSLSICAIYYFPVCYLWLTRKSHAPRISLIESILRRFTF